MRFARCACSAARSDFDACKTAWAVLYCKKYGKIAKEAMRMEFEIKREMRFDVAVLGGGTVGVFAAISAAKTGAKTVLVEKNARLGGTVTAGGVNYPGLFYAWGKQIIGGPCWEAIERTARLGGATIPAFAYKPAHHWEEQILLDKLVYTKVLSDMCREAGVTVMTNAMLSAACEERDGLSLLITDKAGLLSVKAETAVDASGDATLAVILGYETVRSAVQQPATLDNHLCGYTREAVDLIDLKEKWEACPLAGKTPLQRVLWYLDIAKINSHVDSVAADLPDCRARLEEKAIDELYAHIAVLKTVRGLENLQVDRLADEVGVRETVRIVGEYTVTAEEYVRGEKYEDAICNAFYPVDLHVEQGIEQTFLSDGVVPTVPYRALIPKGASRLLCAGRLVSSDTYANSALRVQAPCMAMGQAAGVAAAIAARTGESVRALPIEKIREALSALGAILP